MLVSSWKGLAPVSFPDEWAQGFDPDSCFARVGDEARILFPSVRRAFATRVEGEGPHVRGLLRELTPEEIEATGWGPLNGTPWEPWSVAQVFGHGPILRVE